MRATTQSQTPNLLLGKPEYLQCSLSITAASGKLLINNHVYITEIRPSINHVKAYCGQRQTFVFFKPFSSYTMRTKWTSFGCGSYNPYQVMCKAALRQCWSIGGPVRDSRNRTTMYIHWIRHFEDLMSRFPRKIFTATIRESGCCAKIFGTVKRHYDQP